MLKLAISIIASFLLLACSDEKPAARTKQEQAAADARFDTGKPVDRTKNKGY